jgi:subtilisin-like proprotein convertase family protein
MKPFILSFLCLFFLFIHTQAQTFTGTGGSIPDAGPEVAFPVAVSGLPANINTTFGLETVCLNITHTYDADLFIKLRAPDGTTVNLVYSTGGGDDNFINTCLNANSSIPLSAGSAPFTGTFKPMGPIGNMNNGQNPNGTWNLLIQDVAGADVGDLIDFSITFGNAPDTPFTFTSTNLPIVIINTMGNIIQDEPKVMAKMGVIYNGVGAPNHPTNIWNNYDGWIGIEYRGSSSSGFMQKSYGIETRDSLGNELTPYLLNMPPEQDWALIAAYDDKSLMRNALTYELCNQMGDYAPRTRFCEVFLDGEYKGVYILAEKVKRDANRVNIAKLLPTDISGDELTGGYILKVDNGAGSWNGEWNSPYPPQDGNGSQVVTFKYQYPQITDLQPEQDAYIQGYVDSFETALAGTNFTDTNIGYRHFADMNSFIDNFIINEITRNVDGYRRSYFFYKDKNSNGGKLKSGPAWDYNLAWWNADYCNGFADTGWAYRFGADCPDDGQQLPFWWGKMLQDTNYANALKCRWEDMRTSTLSNQHIFAYIDSTAILLNGAQQRHFEVMPILGMYTWPNPSPLAQTYNEEITHMKDWITLRMTWLDANIPGTCYPPPPPPPLSVTNAVDKNAINIYPNPFAKDIKIDLIAEANDVVQIELYSSVGQKVFNESYSCKAGENHYKLTIDDRFASGVYILKVKGKSFNYTERILKQVK